MRPGFAWRGISLAMSIGSSAFMLVACSTPQCLEDQPEAIAPSWVLNHVDRDAAHVEVIEVESEGPGADHAVVFVRVDDERERAVSMRHQDRPDEFGCRWQVVEVQDST